MTSFFREVISNASNRTRDKVIKETLINNLSDCVKDIQFSIQSEDRIYRVLESDDSTNSLCVALEGIFLHGIKDNLFRKAKIALRGDVDQRPQPSFWPLIMILSHSQSIEQILSLSQIKTEIGQCRAWLRLALNDCLLSSYLATLMRSVGNMKPFYEQSAFIRDTEILDITQRLIQGLESCSQFNLPTNSSLLNSWPEQVLILAGVCLPNLKSCPITTGVDIASTLGENDTVTKAPPDNINRTPITGLGQMLALNEDEAINFILSEPLSESPSNIVNHPLPEPLPLPAINEDLHEKITKNDSPEATPIQEEHKEQEVKSFCDLNLDTASLNTDEKRMTGNSLSGKVGWSTDNLDDLLNSISSQSSDPIFISESKTTQSPANSSSLLDGSYDNTPNIHEMMKDLHNELRVASDECTAISVTAPSTSDDPLLEGLGFEVVSHSSSSIFNPSEIKLLTKQCLELSREKGLDSQNYQCKSCHADIISSSGLKAKVCAFTGEYHCPNCMDPNDFIIPARVIHNWDFHRYPVSTKAATFLLEFQNYPLIDFKKSNRLIYSGVDRMCQLRTLRIQLNFLRGYLFTCREPIIEDLQKRVWPREYLYEHIHVYSISDLEQILNDSLLQQLEKIVLFARAHVRDCLLCSQKGFICEVCHDPSVIYPFNTSSTFRCEECSAVFHSNCLKASMPCPKCERLKKRLSMPLIDAIQNKSKR